MTIIRSWRYPSPDERLTWDEVYARARAIPGAESPLIIPATRIEDAVSSAINTVSEYCWRHEEWYSDLTAWPQDGIMLPWRPNGVVRCSWLLEGSDEVGRPISSDLWEVSGTTWRWLGGESGWPTGTVRWSMEAIGTPVGADVETVYCSVPYSILRPLLELEITAILQASESKPKSDILKELTMLRPQVLKSLRIPQRPPTLIRGANTGSSGWVIFESWGDQAYTFQDLP